MVEHSPQSLDLTFRALSDPSRRQILSALASGDRTVSELARPLRMSLAAASKHIKVLERAGLMHRSRRGRTHICRIEPAPLVDAQQLLAFYIQARPNGEDKSGTAK